MVPNTVNSNFVQVFDSDPDQYGFFAFTDYGDDEIRLTLNSTTLAAILTDALPTALMLSDFDGGGLIRIDETGVPNGGQIFFNLTSLTTVPLPAAFPLFLAGLAGLGFVRRKGIQQRN